MISPLTEWAGLKGDAFRQKRELLRLQREETVSEIVRRTAERRKPELTTTTSVPNKFMITFLEQASLEDKNDPLVDLWANLLTSALEYYSPQYVYFVSMISRISSQQAKIFTSIFRAEDLHALELARDNITSFFEFQYISDTTKQFIKNDNPNNDEEFSNSIVTLLDCPGISIVHGSFENVISSDYYDIYFPYMSYEDGQEADYSILESIGLIRRVDFGFVEIDKWSVSISYYYLTSLGFHFAKACKMLPDGVPR